MADTTVPKVFPVTRGGRVAGVVLTATAVVPAAPVVLAVAVAPAVVEVVADDVVVSPLVVVVVVLGSTTAVPTEGGPVPCAFTASTSKL
jgi:hypothetical protein